MKKFYSMLAMVILCQVCFSQSTESSTAGEMILPNCVTTFMNAGVFGDSVVHLVWENFDENNVKEVELEKSADGVNYSVIARAKIAALTDVHSNNYPKYIDYFNSILLTSEHGNYRFIYNDVVKSKVAKKAWYRVRMINHSGAINVSQIIDSDGELNNTGKTISATSASVDLNIMKGGGGEKGCPPVATPPAGYINSGQTQTFNTSCCSWTETLFTDTSIVNTCGNSTLYCCNNVPGASSCPSGLVSDPCCTHYCANYYSCGCTPWQCCNGSNTQQWVVTQSANLSAMGLTAVSQDASCYNTSDGFINLNVTNAVQPVSYSWSNGSSSQNLSNIAAGIYSVTVTDSAGCTIDSTFQINATLSSPFSQPDICIVSVDTAQNKNVVVWEKPNGIAGINQYYIYRETAQAGVYGLIGFQNASVVSTFTDATSNPAQQAYRYKLAIFDNCGTVSPQSSFHETIHLTASIGINNEVNLIWNHYIGFTFGTYNIYRGSSLGSLVLLNSVSSSNNSYSDLTPPPGNLYYLIEAVRPIACAPSKDIASTRSNILQMAITGIAESNISKGIHIFPNPCSGLFTISIDGAEMKDVNCTVSSTLGQDVYEGILNGKSASIDLTGIAKGIYFLNMKNKDLNKVGKIVVE